MALDIDPPAHGRRDHAARVAWSDAISRPALPSPAEGKQAPAAIGPISRPLDRISPDREGWYPRNVTATAELIGQILELPRENRALVAVETLASLEPPDPGVEEAWDAEIERRVGALVNGGAETLPWETVLARAKSALANR